MTAGDLRGEILFFMAPNIEEGSPIDRRRRSISASFRAARRGVRVVEEKPEVRCGDFFFFSFKAFVSRRSVLTRISTLVSP